MAEKPSPPPPHFYPALSSSARHGSSAGLAIVLSEDDISNNAKNPSILSSTEDNERREIERTLGHIFDVASSALPQVNGSFNSRLISDVLDDLFKKFYVEANSESCQRNGVCIFESRLGKNVVRMDEGNHSGDMRFSNESLLLESHAMFSSARANACVWKGKWMYEVTLETAGIQQLGWATPACPFTTNEGVGDDEESYAYDGRRMRKWNKEPQSYGQSWVVGDIIGCCIDLDVDEISFYRNGVSLGVAFYGIKRPVSGYFPALSLSQGERCEVNFGSRPFRYPVEGFLPLQPPPKVKDGDWVAPVYDIISYLLKCLLRLVKLSSSRDLGASKSMRMFKKSTQFQDLFYPVGNEICKRLFSLMDCALGVKEYVVWGALVPFLLETFGSDSPHDSESLDKVIDLFMSFSEFQGIISPTMQALAYNCKTSVISLLHCPYTGSYPYLALACHILRREEIMLHWWTSSCFDSTMEGMLSRKAPNKQDLQELLPVVWWPGCREDLTSENAMKHTISALGRSIEKVEEMQFELCRLLTSFCPYSMPSQAQGSAFRTFLQNLIWKNRGAERNVLPPGLSNNSVLVSAFTVLLRFLSEGFGMDNVLLFMKSPRQSLANGIGFLHRGGKRSFPVALFLKADTYCIDFSRLGGTLSHLLKTHPISDDDLEEIQWDEALMEREENTITHSSRQKPCCCSCASSSCSSSGKNLVKSTSKCSSSHHNTMTDRAAINRDCTSRSFANEVEDKASTSEQSHSEFFYQPVQMREASGPTLTQMSSGSLREEELFDMMVLLYHLGLVPNFKQASYYMSHQSHCFALLDDTDEQIRAGNTSSDHLRHLKEARNVYREDLVDCVRQCAWYKIALLARWKQRGMYAVCMLLSQLLLILSSKGTVFLCVPEFYVETLVDCFHALRRSDPPFVSSASLLTQGLSSFVTFLVMHFNDLRIANTDLRDVLLQSISVLVRYKEYLPAFEMNKAAVERMPAALLQAFDNRFWIPITNILLRLCKGSGFGSSKHNETWSKLFQGLLQEKCTSDEKLFANFLNRLFNTLSWTITEFSISLKQMQEHAQVPDLQQRKCAVIFELSCKLARLLEFFTSEVPYTFLCGSSTNMMRLAELTVFVLSHTTSTAEAELFDNMLRQQGQSPEKVNRAMILAPVVGMILNLSKMETSLRKPQNSLLHAFANMNCSARIESNLEQLLEFNWVGFFKSSSSMVKLMDLKRFVEELKAFSKDKRSTPIFDGENDDEICCICYASKIDTMFVPCNHRSCLQCISRHLLNNQRCFFCNSVVTEVCPVSNFLPTEDNSYSASGRTNTVSPEGRILIKLDSVSNNSA